MSKYLNYSRTPYYAVVASLPLLIIYELLLTWGGGFAQGQVRNAADVWMKMVLVSLGLSPFHATLAMILALILAIPVLQPRSAPLVGRYFWLMLTEAIFYGFFLGIIINYILIFIFTIFLPSPPGIILGGLQAAMPSGGGFLQGLALSLGAGLFEELFFRVILLGLLLYVTRLFMSPWISATVSILGAAFLFSLAHYMGPMGESLDIQSFLFRWVAGLLFTMLYYWRGFAVTAYSHAFYDIWVITGVFRIIGW